MSDPYDPNQGNVPPPPSPPGGGFTPPPPPPPPGGGFPPPPPGGGFTPPPPPPGGGFPPAPAPDPSGYTGGYQPYTPGVSTGAPDGGASLSYGWAKFQQNVGPILIGMLIWIVAVVVLYVVGLVLIGAVSSVFTTEETIGGITYETSSGGFLAAILITALWMTILMAANFAGSFAVTRGALTVTEGRALTVEAMLDRRNLGTFILTSLLQGLVVGIGSFLCYLPGLVAMFFLAFAPYFALDQGTSPVESLKRSFEVTKANAGSLVVYFLMVIAAYIVGALLCGVGLLVAIPVILIGNAHMYKTLTGQPVAA